MTEIDSVEDLRGSKVRISSLGGSMVSNMDAIDQQAAAGDIYPSPEKCTPDAVEFNEANDNQEMGSTRSRLLLFPGFWAGSRAAAFVANYERLPKYDAANAAPKQGRRRRRIVKQFPQDVLAARFKSAHDLRADSRRECGHPHPVRGYGKFSSDR